MDFSPFFISLEVALLATVITFALGLAAANFVQKMKKGKGLLDVFLTLPLVLPPTVVGFFLLLIFGINSLVGKMLHAVGVSVVFSWIGAVVAATVVSFPLMYRTTRGALEQIDPTVIYAAETLGLSNLKIFWTIKLPLAWPGILAGTVLAFARALGEFGATIMLAGNIPGRTQTMAIAVYSAVQGGDRALAFKWVAVLCLMSFVMMMVMNYSATDRKHRRQSRKNKSVNSHDINKSKNGR